MARPRTAYLAESLERASTVAERHILRSRDISRTDRERLLKMGYLCPIIKGWYLLTTPDRPMGESTAWFGSFWDFLALYLDHRFGEAYCLGAESSLELHIGQTVVPRQITVITGRGGQMVLKLPHETSLLAYQDPANLPEESHADRHATGLRIMSLPLALTRLVPAYFARHTSEVDIALRMLSDPADLAHVLVDRGQAAAAGRLVGALRHLGRTYEANQILADLEAAGYDVQVTNPFEEDYTSPLEGVRVQSPYPARIKAAWHLMRPAVIEGFPKPPGRPRDVEAYLSRVDAEYRDDAYHSLSIEGFKVTPELIERMRSGEYAPELDASDRSRHDAMAALGYHRAFQLVEQSLQKILKGESPGLVVTEDLHAWYRALFSPHMDGGLLTRHELIGYRRHAVYINGSQHVPPPYTAVGECMAMLFDLLVKEEEASVRAVLGHFMFGFIHPYMDGNGRLARFLMNAMLASGGYPWTVITAERRIDYLKALERASVHRDPVAFTRFIHTAMQDHLQGG